VNCSFCGLELDSAGWETLTDNAHSFERCRNLLHALLQKSREDVLALATDLQNYHDRFDELVDLVAEQRSQFDPAIAARRAEMGRTTALVNQARLAAQTEETLSCCWECASAQERMSRMILCPSCGNKRCPRATQHTLACTGSNEPDQPGSRYNNAYVERTHG
jgi:Zn finger protein HypA/HybF involved in hydrogenase expression